MRLLRQECTSISGELLSAHHTTNLWYKQNHAITVARPVAPPTGRSCRLIWNGMESRVDRSQSTCLYVGQLPKKRLSRECCVCKDDSYVGTTRCQPRVQALQTRPTQRTKIPEDMFVPRSTKY
jgi:hypothetical protein